MASRKREKPFQSRSAPYCSSKRRRRLPLYAAVDEDRVDEFSNSSAAAKAPTTVMVIGVPKECSVLDLKARFEMYGPISRTRMEPNGVAYVNFRSNDAAQSAVGAAQDSSFPLTVHSVPDGSSLNSYDEEIYEDEVSAVEEIHQGVSEAENASQVQAQTKQGLGNTKVNENSDINLEEELPSTKLYQNSKGGSRGGRDRRPYSNDRGWRSGSRGGYQNGHNQFYDQPGVYYPRNNYFRGRGGRGMRGHYAQGVVHVGHVEAAS